jgi:hypothetical protein
MMDRVYAFLSFVCGVLLLIVGGVNFFKHVMGHRWCDESCFGPYLFWDKDDFFDDRNSRFRQTFSLMPKPFGEHFGVFLLALLTLKVHFHHANARSEGTTFMQNAAWLVFVAFFAAFPFAGGFGIVVGFLSCAVAAVGIGCHLLKVPGSATLGLTLDGNTRAVGRCGDLKLPDWFYTFWNISLVVLLSLTVLNNFVHIFKNEFHHWCKDNSDETCIGPYLIWPEDFARSVNVDKWGSVFSLDLNRTLELWTPLLLVVWFIGTGSNSWFMTSLYLVALALFGAFGFGGNMGIVVGIMLVAAAVVSFVISALGGHEAHQAPVGGYSLMGGGYDA